MEEMKPYEICSIVLSGLTLVAVTATAVIYFFQLRAMRHQLGAMRDQLQLTQKQVDRLEHSSAWEQKYKVLTSLDDIRPESERVLELAGKDFASWTPADREAALKVCYKLHILGALLVDQESVVRLFGWTWFYSLPRCHQILKPLIDEYRRTRDDGQDRYFSAFDHLMGRAEEAIRVYRGFTAPGAEQYLRA